MVKHTGIDRRILHTDEIFRRTTRQASRSHCPLQSHTAPWIERYLKTESVFLMPIQRCPMVRWSYTTWDIEEMAWAPSPGDSFLLLKHLRLIKDANILASNDYIM